MTRDELFLQISLKNSFLCIGLDTDLQKIPVFLRHSVDPLFVFNREIIEATHDLCVSYKLNLAFYESLGSTGWASLEKTVAYIREKYPEIFIIADAKRGDIGNTSGLYARAFFTHMDFDAVTTAPYMGEDSIKPFLVFPGRWVILLALTSNRGSSDFQYFEDSNGERLFERVLKKSAEWGSADNMMFVVGATRAGELQRIRQIVPDHFLLVPGVGAQGGSLAEAAVNGMNRQCGLLVNSSRAVIYASAGEDFAVAARSEAIRVRDEMKGLLSGAQLI